MATIFAIVIAYLLGSISSSIIVAKIMGTADPRSVGSGNAGATNVLRSAGKKQAAIVLVIDILKGFIAVVIGHALSLHPFMLGFVALAAVAGHIFPIFFGFKGGKGVATALGTVFALSPISGILCAAAWIAIAFTTRYSSLASLVTVILAPVFLFIFSFKAYFIPVALIALLIIYKHKANIIRLQNRTESKIELK